MGDRKRRRTVVPQARTKEGGGVDDKGLELTEKEK